MSSRLVLTATMIAILGVGALAWLAPTTSTTLATASAPAAIVQGHNNYGLHSLHGSQGFSYAGTRIGVGPVASSGRIEFDGAGNLSAVFTTSVNGMAFTGTFTGSYTVQGDGTGSVVIDLPWLGTQAHGNFVIVDRGNGTYFTSTDAGYSVTGTTQRM